MHTCRQLEEELRIAPGVKDVRSGSSAFSTSEGGSCRHNLGHAQTNYYVIRNRALWRPGVALGVPNPNPNLQIPYGDVLDESIVDAVARPTDCCSFTDANGHIKRPSGSPRFGGRGGRP